MKLLLLIIRHQILQLMYLNCNEISERKIFNCIVTAGLRQSFQRDIIIELQLKSVHEQFSSHENN